jgi:hypothetical protein
VFTLVVGTFGAVVGGAWLGLAASNLLEPRGSVRDLAATAIALLILVVMALELGGVGGRHALRLFSLTTATATSTVFLAF